MSVLTLRMSEKDLVGFHSILGTGVGVDTISGITLLDLLCGRLGFDRGYVDRRVQTIFHNGKAVDRIDQVRIEDGDVIALSAAMPGLAGATLRKSGVFATMRKNISHAGAGDQNSPSQKASVTLKLFNLVARELGPQLLRQGVWVRADQLLESIDRLPPETLTIVYEGRQVTIEALSHLCRPAESIFLSIEHPASGL
jgi:hypothetical protein